VVETLEQRGLLGQDFFEILKSERPRRVDEVESLRVAYAQKSGAPSTPKTEKELLSPGASMDRSAVYKALVGLSPGDFKILFEIGVDPEARLIASSHTGQSQMALALISHYDVPYRGLDKLVNAIREVTTNLI